MKNCTGSVAYKTVDGDTSRDKIPIAESKTPGTPVAAFAHMVLL